MNEQIVGLPEGYSDWLAELKGNIAQARQRAALAVNAELVRLYHRIGCEIQSRQQAHGWGGEGHRAAGSGSQGCVSGYERLVGKQPQVNAFFRSALP